MSVTPPTPGLVDLGGALACERRPGDAWSGEKAGKGEVPARWGPGSGRSHR